MRYPDTAARLHAGRGRLLLVEQHQRWRAVQRISRGDFEHSTGRALLREYSKARIHALHVSAPFGDEWSIAESITVAHSRNDAVFPAAAAPGATPGSATTIEETPSAKSAAESADTAPASSDSATMRLSSAFGETPSPGCDSRAFYLILLSGNHVE